MDHHPHTRQVSSTALSLKDPPFSLSYMECSIPKYVIYACRLQQPHALHCCLLQEPWCTQLVYAVCHRASTLCSEARCKSVYRVSRQVATQHARMQSTRSQTKTAGETCRGMIRLFSCDFQGRQTSFDLELLVSLHTEALLH